MFSKAPTADQARTLILDAEREAQLVSAFARLLIVSIAAAIFLVAGGTHLPVAPVVLTYLGSYALISAASAVFSTRRYFRPWLGLVFTAVDGASLALLIGFALLVTGSSFALHGAVPGFFFIFCILILASMRYTVGPAIVACTSFVVTWWLFASIAADPVIADQSGAARGTDPDFFFGPVQNAARWGFLGIATILSILAVVRRRKTLETAISSTIKTANLSRYFPERIASLVAEQGIEALTSGKQQNAVIVFVDLRGFTGMSERMAPADLNDFLSAFRSLVSEEVDAHGGFVEKFIGDAVMVVFGVPDGRTGYEKNAVQFTLAVLNRIEKWNVVRSAGGQEDVSVTLGAHAGVVFSGAVGTADRMEFTVLGDVVNIAARLQEIAKDTRSGVAISRDLLELAGQLAEEETHWLELETVSIRGRAADISAYSYVRS